MRTNTTLALGLSPRELICQWLHKMTPLILVFWMVIGSICAGDQAQSAEPTRGPNVVLILTDDKYEQFP